eukprot:TRINITY_DN8869_c0_g1_i1.p1 TRINITY_DN8869_c0_g1~~TRINITY_DN8869_c0_g1_i1.p1  ORF type:complete len:982 (-),score=164.47 TRINITY_DN8869_c0_g1_i1:2082-4808(-)
MAQFPNMRTPSYVNELHTFFGQLITTDITSSKKGGNEYMYWDVPEGDEYLDRTNTGNLTTSLLRYPAYTGEDAPDYKTPVNLVTSYLDLSFVYGSTLEVNDKVRTYEGGKLILELDVNKITDPFRIGGDERINETPPMAAFHALFALEHNRLCDLFAKDNSDWDDEQIFQEARRINIAYFQKIVIREYLASTIGKHLEPYYDIDGNGGYDPDVNPSVDIFFSTVAQRYGHSAVTGIYERMGNNGFPVPEGPQLVRDTLYRPDLNKIHKDYTYENLESSDASILRGLANQLSGNVDVVFCPDMRNFVNLVEGKDLFSVNIARGRDLGIPDYNSAREYYGLSRVNSFDEISSNNMIVQQLEALYEDIDDIDAYIGAISEDIQDGSIVPPLMSASIEDQYQRLRDGDRFWFENTDYFSKEEIAEVLATSLRDLVGRNFPSINVDVIPSSAFFVSDRQLQLTDGVSATDLFQYDVLNEARTQLLSDDYFVTWDVDDSTNEITINIQVKNDGWVGIGFNPTEENSMKGADIIFCRFVNDIGDHTCLDYHAVDIGAPTLDTDLGGNSDIISSTGEIVDGISIFEIKRKLDTGDTLDAIIRDEDTIVIFAYHLTSHNIVYHGPTRGSTGINFMRGSIAKNPLIMRVNATIFSCLGILLCFICSVSILKNKEYFRYQTPEFCIIICTGGILGYLSILILHNMEPSTLICTLHIWMVGISFNLVFVCLLVKTYRIHKTYVSTKKLKITVVTLKDIWKLLIVALVFEIVLLSLWTYFSAPTDTLLTLGGADIQYLVCSTDSSFWYAFAAEKLIMIIYGVSLAVRSWNMDTTLNDSREITISIFIFMFLLIISTMVGILNSENPLTLTVLYSFPIVFAYTPTIIILFVPTIVNIIKGKPRVSGTSLSSVKSKNSVVQTN